MKLQDYQPLAMRTAKFMEPLDMLVHGAMGCGSESGEFAVTAHTFLTKETFDRPNAVEEAGDGMWFAAYMAEALGMDISVIAHGLQAPYAHAKGQAPFEHSVCIAALNYAAAGADIVTRIKAHKFYGKALDLLALEGELRAYVAAIYSLCDAMKVNLSEVLEANIAKLRKRYADKYSDVAAIARADKANDIDPAFPAAHYGHDLYQTTQQPIKPAHLSINDTVMTAGGHVVSQSIEDDVVTAQPTGVYTGLQEPASDDERAARHQTATTMVLGGKPAAQVDAEIFNRATSQEDTMSNSIGQATD